MKCIIENCKRNDIVARFLCSKHHCYYKRHRQLFKFPLMQREKGSGQITKGGYKRITVGKNRIFEHRYIVELALKRKLLPTEKIHHIDGNPINNSLRNLLVVSQHDHLTKFHNNRPRVFDWNVYIKHKSPVCIVCNKPSHGNFDLCKSHYGTYSCWRRKH